MPGPRTRAAPITTENPTVAKINEHLQRLVERGDIVVYRPEYFRERMQMGRNSNSFLCGVHTFAVGPRIGTYGSSSIDALIEKFLPPEFAEGTRVLGILREVGGVQEAAARPGLHLVKLELQAPATEDEIKRVGLNVTPERRGDIVRIVVEIYPSDAAALGRYQHLEALRLSRASLQPPA